MDTTKYTAVMAESQEFTFPAIGEEPFNLTPAELSAEWASTEALTSEAFRKIMSPVFHLTPEVTMLHHSGEAARIDYVGVDRLRRVDEPIGFEIKKATYADQDYKQFSRALKQAADYSESVITDPRSKRFQGKRLRYVFVFPCLFPAVGGAGKAMWAQGALRLAGQWGVGVMSYDSSAKDWGLFLGCHPAWWLGSGPWHQEGPTHLGLNHKRIDSIGSGKRGR